MASARPVSVSCRLCGLAPDKGVPAYEVDVVALSEKHLRTLNSKLDADKLKKAFICHFCLSGAKVQQISTGVKGIRKLRSPRPSILNKKRQSSPDVNQIIVKEEPEEQQQLKGEPILPKRPPIPPSLKYKCTYCPRKFLNKTSRYDHVFKFHSNMAIFRCNFCLIFFKKKEEELDHIKGIHSDHLKCSFCSTRFENYDWLELHISQKHKEDSVCYKCSDYTCRKLAFWSTEELGEHIRLAHESAKDLPKCIYCGQFVLSLRKHVMQLHREVAIKCDYNSNCCNYFLTEEDRQNHVQERHLKFLRGDVSCWCVFCGERLARKVFADHLDNLHSDESIRYEFSNENYTLGESAAERQEEATELKMVMS